MSSVWFWLAAIGASAVLAFASYLYTVLAHAPAGAIKLRAPALTGGHVFRWSQKRIVAIAVVPANSPRSQRQTRR